VLAAILAVLTGGTAWIAASRRKPSGIMRLPSQARELAGLSAAARDPAGLARQLKARGYGAIAVEGPADAAGMGWNPRSSEIYIQFWKLFTAPGERDARGSTVYRLVPSPARRMLALGEPPGLAEIRLNGESLERDGKALAALAAFRASQASAPGLPALAYGAARCYRALGKPRKAEAELRKAISQSGPDPVLFEALGETYETMKNRRLAAIAYEQAAGLDGSSARLWIRAARALKAFGNMPAAAAAAGRALALDPGNRDAAALSKAVQP
jgi:tetratricopeptide (TPR) repeat protein